MQPRLSPRHRYGVTSEPIWIAPIDLSMIAPKLERGHRVKLGEKIQSNQIRGEYGYVTRWDVQTGFFFVYIPTIAEKDEAYRRYEFGPFSMRDFEKGVLEHAEPESETPPGLDEILGREPRFKRLHKQSRFKRLRS